MEEDHYGRRVSWSGFLSNPNLTKTPCHLHSTPTMGRLLGLTSIYGSDTNLLRLHHVAAIVYFQVLPYLRHSRVRGNDGGLSFIYGGITANWYDYIASTLGHTFLHTEFVPTTAGLVRDT